eukprot:6212336-Pleurochrysis_carterae.AAC.4
MQGGVREEEGVLTRKNAREGGSEGRTDGKGAVRRDTERPRKEISTGRKNAGRYVNDGYSVEERKEELEKSSKHEEQRERWR